MTDDEKLILALDFALCGYVGHFFPNNAEAMTSMIRRELRCAIEIRDSLSGEENQRFLAKIRRIHQTIVTQIEENNAR